MEDIKKCAQLSDKDDPAVGKATERLKKELKLQKEKDKSWGRKLFG